MDARSRAGEILQEIEFDFQTFTIEKFANRISVIKGRNIFMIPWTMPKSLFGAWLTDGEQPKEYIFYRNNVPPIHQVHIQLHELAHLLFGHSTLKIDRNLILTVLKGEFELPFNDLVLLRSPKKTEIETEAETLASMIQEQVIRHSQLLQLVRDISSNEKLARFLDDLGLA